MYVIEACQVQVHAVFTTALDGQSRNLNHGRFTTTETVAENQSVGRLASPDSAWE
jgi:hypothetical protein